MRLFVAIDLPASWKAAAGRLQGALPADARRHARLVDPENMHITVRFIGEVDEGAVPTLRDALASRLPPVEAELRLGAVGTFGPPARTSVVWLGIDGDLDALRALHGRADEAVHDALGVPPEGRPYSPHITLARVRNHVSNGDRRAIAEAVRTLRVPHVEPLLAREAILVRSRLGSDGPHYETLARFGG